MSANHTGHFARDHRHICLECDLSMIYVWEDSDCARVTFTCVNGHEFVDHVHAALRGRHHLDDCEHEGGLTR